MYKSAKKPTEEEREGMIELTNEASADEYEAREQTCGGRSHFGASTSQLERSELFERPANGSSRSLSTSTAVSPQTASPFF